MLRFDKTDKYKLKEVYNEVVLKELKTYFNTEDGNLIYRC